MSKALSNKSQYAQQDLKNHTTLKNFDKNQKTDKYYWFADFNKIKEIDGWIMGHLINFPENRSIAKKHLHTPQEVQESGDFQEAPYILSSLEEDHAFLNLIKEWPCFNHIDCEETLESIFESYYDDELTLPQDCVLEFMFHMQDPSSAFDIANALYTWDEDDKNFFMLSLNMHSELIEQLKNEEL